MIEVTVDGISFSSLGIGVKRHDIPILPDTVDYSQAISGRDGEIDFGSVYGKRTINIECILMADDATLDYQAKVARIAELFHVGKGDRIYTFSDLTSKRYLARYAGSLPIQKIIFDGEFTLPLVMHDPFPEALRDTTVYEYGQGLEYGQGYEYSSFSISVTAATQTFTIDNFGTVDSPPLIRITGALTNLSLSDGKRTFLFTGTMNASSVLEIDCALSKCTVKLNGTNAFGQTNGVFLILKPGLTTFTTSATNPNFKIEFIFRPKYLY